MQYKIASMDEISESIYNPRTYYQKQNSTLIIIFLAFVNILVIIVFFLLTDDFANALKWKKNIP